MLTLPFSKRLMSLKNIIILIILTSILLFAYVWTRLKTIELSYLYSKLSIKERNLIEENMKLRLELASLKSPEKLMEIAKKKFGFKKTPSQNKILIKRSNKD